MSELEQARAKALQDQYRDIAKTRDHFENKVLPGLISEAKTKGSTPTRGDISEWRRRYYDQYIQPKRDEAVRSTVAFRQSAQESIQSPVAKWLTQNVAAPAVAGAAAFADAGTFNQGANLASLLPAASGQMGQGEAEESARARLAAAREMNPVASTAGTLVGVFGKTPFGALTNFAGKAAGAIPGRLAAKIGERTFETLLAKHASNMAAQIGANVASAGGSIGVMRMLTDSGMPTDFVDRMSQIRDDMTSPTTLALAGGAGMIQGAARVKSDPEIVRFIDDMKRKIPGFRPSPDLYRRPGNQIQRMFEEMRHIPGVATLAQKWHDTAYLQPLRKSIDSFRATLGPDQTDDAMQALRNTIGTEAKPGIIKGGMGKIQARARTGPTMSIEVPKATIINFLRSSVKFARAENAKIGETRGTTLGKVIRDLRVRFIQQQKEIAKTGSSHIKIDVASFDKIRDRLDDVVHYAPVNRGGNLNTTAYTERDIREARMLSGLVREFINQNVPPLAMANRATTTLHRYMDAFGEIADTVASGSADDLLAASLGPKGFESTAVNGEKIVGRFEAMRRTLPASVMQKIRASYALKYLGAAVQNKGDRPAEQIFGANSVRRMSEGGGPFRSQVADALVPGLRKWVEERARLSQMVSRGLGSAKGAATGSRHITAAGIGAVAMLPIAVYEMASDDRNGWARTALGALGAVGTGYLIHSTLNGAAGSQLNALATGRAVTGPTTTQAVLAQRGGSMAEQVNQGLGMLPEIAGQAAEGIARLGQQ